MPRRIPTGGRFAQPCVDPALPLCDLNSLWTHAYEKLMAENRRLLAANSSEPGTYLDYSNFLMAIAAAFLMVTDAPEARRVVRAHQRQPLARRDAQYRRFIHRAELPYEKNFGSHAACEVKV